MSYPKCVCLMVFQILCVCVDYILFQILLLIIISFDTRKKMSKINQSTSEILCHRAQWLWNAASRIYGSWCWLCRHMQSTSYPLSATYCTTTVKHAKLHTVALCSLTQRTSASAVQPGSKMKTLVVSSSEWVSSIILFCGTLTSHKYYGGN